jgi:hypothetical protein
MNDFDVVKVASFACPVECGLDADSLEKLFMHFLKLGREHIPKNCLKLKHYEVSDEDGEVSDEDGEVSDEDGEVSDEDG